MPVTFPRGITRKPRERAIGILLATAGWIFCVVTTFHLRQLPHFGIDYLSIFSSSSCLLDGCNPYSGLEMKSAFLAHGGILSGEVIPADAQNGAFSPFYVGYPPSSLFYFMPLAALSWPMSWHVWIALSLTAYWLAALLFATLDSEYSPLSANLCLACFLAMQWVAVFLMQPTILPAALLCIGMWSLLKGRWITAGTICFAVSLVLKPQLGALGLLYFFFANSVARRRAFHVAVLTILLCLPGLAWAGLHVGTAHWVHDLTVNIKGVASPGHLSDPGPTGSGNPEQITDLQTIVSLIHNDPAFYNPVVFGFCLVLFAVWLYPVLTLPNSREKDLVCLAAILSFSMLPIYHREYDSMILVAIFPAIALLLKKTPRWGISGGGLTLALALSISRHYQKYVLDWSLPPMRRLIGRIVGQDVITALLERPVALCLLLLTTFFLVVLYKLPEQLKDEGEMVSPS